MKTFFLFKMAVLSMILPFATIAGDLEKALKLNAEGAALLEKGDSEGAVRAFKAAFDADNGCVEAANNIAKILVVAKRYKAAENVLVRALKASPNRIECLIPMAQVKALLGKTEECRLVLENVKASENRNELASIALLLMAQGSMKEAWISIDMAVSCDGLNPKVWFNKGILNENIKDWNAAESCYAKAVELDAKFANAWVNLGNAHLKQKKNIDAEKCYEKALEVSPDHSLAQYNLARLLILSQRDIKRGLSLLEQARKGTDEGARHAQAFYGQLAALIQKGGAK